MLFKNGSFSNELVHHPNLFTFTEENGKNYINPEYLSLKFKQNLFKLTKYYQIKRLNKNDYTYYFYYLDIITIILGFIIIIQKCKFFLHASIY